MVLIDCVIFFHFFIFNIASYINWTTHGILQPETFEYTHFKDSQEPHGKAMHWTSMLGR